LAKPDTRKRDRAAYMRDYRARVRAEKPGLQAQIVALTARLGAAEDWIAMQRNLDADIAARSPVGSSFGQPRPAPKHQPAPTARK